MLQNKAARIILDLPARASASDALARLRWKPLLRRRAEHRAIFTYKSLNNFFSHTFQCSFNRDFHSYNTRPRNNINGLFKVKPVPPLPSHESPQSLAEDFNDYFSSKIQALRDNLQKSSLSTMDMHVAIDSMLIQRICCRI